ncbi:MAG: hypothetical protein AVDCRST_MAG04-3035, partial [uncultured Acetobacteraceae bacterium]
AVPRPASLGGADPLRVDRAAACGVPRRVHRHERLRWRFGEHGGV